MNLLLTGGAVFRNGTFQNMDVAISGGRIVSISPSLPPVSYTHLPLSPGELPGLRQALRPVCLPKRKGSILMKIAVTYENGQVFQHFGHTAQFKLYDVENGAIASSQVVDTNGSGHGALAGFLKDHHVDALISVSYTHLPAASGWTPPTARWAS